MNRRLVLAATVTLAVAAGGLALAARPGERPAGLQRVDYNGLRFSVPSSFVVQSIEGKVDGELKCPDTDGFVLAGAYDVTYFDVTCNPPGAEAIVRVRQAGGATSGPVRQVNGLRYRRLGKTAVEFVDPPVLLFVQNVPEDEAVDQRLLRDILASARRTPAKGAVTPTTAPARNPVGERLADSLGCGQRTKAHTYSRVDSGFLGRQKEPPVDCHAGGHGYRILVLAYEDAHQAAQRYYDRAWLVVGDDWLITAMNERSARFAADRVGGRLRPPPSACCGPPTSDTLPGAEG